MLRTLIYTLILVAVLGGGWYAYDRFIVQDTSRGVLTAGSGAATNGTSSDVQELLQILRTLRGLSLETDLFQDPAYEGLRDFSVRVSEQPQGRSNPFAAI